MRILIGSAKKMGEGLNVQDRVVALHEMNPLARPGDIEQVEARAIRQGNPFTGSRGKCLRYGRYLRYEAVGYITGKIPVH